MDSIWAYDIQNPNLSSIQNKSNRDPSKATNLSSIKNPNLWALKTNLISIIALKTPICSQHLAFLQRIYPNPNLNTPIIAAPKIIVHNIAFLQRIYPTNPSPKTPIPPIQIQKNPGPAVKPTTLTIWTTVWITI